MKKWYFRFLLWWDERWLRRLLFPKYKVVLCCYNCRAEGTLPECCGEPVMKFPSRSVAEFSAGLWMTKNETKAPSHGWGWSIEQC